MVTPPQDPTPVVVNAQAGPAVAAQLPSLASLQGQAQLLQEQLNQLLAQRSGLAVQLRMLPNGQRDGVTAQLKQLTSQIVNTTGDLATARAQIAMRQGKPVPMMVEPSDYQSMAMARRSNDKQVTAVMIVFIVAILMPISLGFTRRLWRRTPKDVGMPNADTISPRLDRLEQAVDSIAIEIERVAEGQRFVTKVLAERMPLAMPVAPKPVGVEAQDAQLRALGAGPIEPIRVAERQAAHQSLTPH